MASWASRMLRTGRLAVEVSRSGGIGRTRFVLSTGGGFEGAGGGTFVGAGVVEGGSGSGLAGGNCVVTTTGGGLLLIAGAGEGWVRVNLAEDHHIHTSSAAKARQSRAKKPVFHPGSLCFRRDAL